MKAVYVQQYGRAMRPNQMDKRYKIIDVIDPEDCKIYRNGKQVYADGEEMTVEFNGTREEAINNCCHGLNCPEAFIQALEALGLVRFEEDKSPISVLEKSIARQGDDVRADVLICALEAKGYKIVPK